MEALFILFAVGVIGVILIGSIMGFTSSGRISKLERQNRNLNERVKTLEAERGEGPARPKVNTKTVSKAEPKKAPDAVPIAAKTPAPVAASNLAPKKTAPNPSTSQAKPASPKPRPKSPPKPKTPTRNLEELIGGQWSVWVGGLALLVGAVLLIRFSIEAGFFGPTARILMALGLGAVLILAGEWLKRSDDKILSAKLAGKFGGKLEDAQKVLQSNASIPGLLSAVGIFSLLGATYAAHELYELIPAAVAFIGLGIIALGAMALSLRQGPLLAAIGLLASMATPLLIQTEMPNFMALVGYLLVIGTAALVLAQRTKWRWLEVGTVFGWLGWSAMSIKAAMNGQMLLWGVFLAIGFAVTVWRSEAALKAAGSKEKSLEDHFDDISLHPYLAVAWGGFAALITGSVAAQSWSTASVVAGPILGYPMPSLILSIGAVAALFGTAILFKRQNAHIVTAGVFVAALSIAKFPSWQMTLFAGLIAVGVLLSLRETLKLKSPETLTPKGKNATQEIGLLWPIFAVGLGLSTLLSFALHGEDSWSREIYVGVTLGYSALFAAFALYSHKSSRPALYTACMTVGAGLAWFIAWAIQLDGLAFSLAMSLGAAISVAAIWALRLPGARLTLLGLAGLVFAHAFLIQFPEAESLSTQPIFNALWAYLALPTVILSAAGYVLHKRKSETSTATGMMLNGIIEAAALAGGALFVVFQIRHLSNGGEVYVDKIGFEELGLQVSTGLCFTLAGLSKRFSGNFVLSKMAEVISYATLAIFALGSLIGLSPFFDISEGITGNLAFNSLTTGLLVPTALLSLCAWRARGRRANIYVNLLGGLALAGAISWVTAMVRFVFNGPTIEIFASRFGDFELWTISAVWLLFGIALLAIGVWRKERALRIASGVLIILTVLKAFLIDMAGLEGVLRAMSFVGLGLVLIVIGRAYQRFWLSGSSDNVAGMKETDA